MDPADLTRRRLRALKLGQITALLCVGCWLVAGVLWPTILTLNKAPQNPTEIYTHFVASFVVCGLIAATYPYVLVTYRAVRVLYPALFGPAGPGPADGPALRRVGRELGVYRVLAAAIPLAAVGVLAGVRVSDPPAVVVLCVTGVAGSVMVYVLEGRIRTDLEALTAMPGAD